MFESTFQHGFVPAPSSSAASSRMVPASTSDPAAWFTRYGTRRYGKTHRTAVQAWEALGGTIYSGAGGGFGSMISSVPTLTAPPGPPGPQPVGPPAPEGFTRKHPADGYWNPPPGAPRLVFPSGRLGIFSLAVLPPLCLTPCLGVRRRSDHGLRRGGRREVHDRHMCQGVRRAPAAWLPRCARDIRSLARRPVACGQRSRIEDVSA